MLEVIDVLKRMWMMGDDCEWRFVFRVPPGDLECEAVAEIACPVAGPLLGECHSMLSVSQFMTGLALHPGKDMDNGWPWRTLPDSFVDTSMGYVNFQTTRPLSNVLT